MRIYAVDDLERKNGHDPEKDLAGQNFAEYFNTGASQPSINNSGVSFGGTSGAVLIPHSDQELDGSDVDSECAKFNEDGSFIGQYSSPSKQQQPTNGAQTQNGGGQQAPL